MSATTITPATKYRVAIREIAKDHGWVFSQITTRVDRFEKDGVTIDVSHGPSNLITTAAKTDGQSNIVTTAKSGKMFDVQAWLTGTPDPDRVHYIRLTADQVAQYESGQGIAKIKVIDPEAPAPVEPAPAKTPRTRKTAAAK